MGRHIVHKDWYKTLHISPRELERSYLNLNQAEISEEKQPVEHVPLRMSSTQANKESSHLFWGYTKHEFNDLYRLPMKADEEMFIKFPEFREQIMKKYT